MYLYLHDSSAKFSVSFRQGKALGKCSFSTIIFVGTSPYPSNRAVTYSQENIVYLITCEFYNYESILQVDPALLPMSGHLSVFFFTNSFVVYYNGIVGMIEN